MVGGVAYVGSQEKVYAFDASTGAALWSWDMASAGGGSLCVDPVVADGVLYVSAGRSLHALDAGTGNELWRVSPGIEKGGVAVDGGVVYASNSSLNSLQALDSATGEVLWTGLTKEGKLSRPAVAGGVVYVHSHAGYLYAFDASSGGQDSCSPLWAGVTQEVKVEGPLAPAVANERVYVGSNE